MKPETQGILLEISEQPASAPLPPVVGEVPAAKPKLKPIDREQGLLRTVIVDELVGEDHKARAIWDLTGALNLSRSYSKIQSKEGKAGSPAWNPRLLLREWLYAYSEQVTSAREVARLMEYGPGLMWLSGLGESGAISSRLVGDGPISMLYSKKNSLVQCGLRLVTQITTPTLAR
jgi:hypothetical protein